jgi:hypothetical protein
VDSLFLSRRYRFFVTVDGAHCCRHVVLVPAVPVPGDDPGPISPSRSGKPFRFLPFLFPSDRMNEK